MRARSILTAIAALAAAVALTACAMPAAVEKLARPTAREGYAAFLRAKAIRAESAIDINALSSSLMAEILPYDREVAARAQAFFGADPALGRELAEWQKSGPGTRPVVVLLGLYAPDLGEKDVTGQKEKRGAMSPGRFRPRLQVGGATLEPALIKRYGRDSAFMRDYFPVFNRWEEAFAARFDVPAGSAGQPLAFILEAPGLTQTLSLAW